MAHIYKGSRRYCSLMFEPTNFVICKEETVKTSGHQTSVPKKGNVRNSSLDKVRREDRSPPEVVGNRKERNICVVRLETEREVYRKGRP